MVTKVERISKTPCSIMIDFEILGPFLNRDRHFHPILMNFNHFFIKVFRWNFLSQSDLETTVPYAGKLTLNTHDFIHDDTSLWIRGYNEDHGTVIFSHGAVIINAIITKGAFWKIKTPILTSPVSNPHISRFQFYFFLVESSTRNHSRLRRKVPRLKEVKKDFSLDGWKS